MTSRRLLQSSVFVLLLAACQSQSEAPAFTAEDEAAVRAMFDNTPGYFLNRTFGPWAQQFAEDGIFQPPNAPTVRGRTALQAWAEAFPPMETASFSNVQVTGEGNMAWGTSDYALKLKDGPSDNGKQLVVFRKTNGSWQIVAGAFSSDLPPAGQPAASATTTR
jgi:ketosteroid isomerase-like protein